MVTRSIEGDLFYGGLFFARTMSQVSSLFEHLANVATIEYGPTRLIIRIKGIDRKILF